MNILYIVTAWIKTNFNNIVSGIVASVIVLLLQVIVKTLSMILSAFLTIRWRLKLIWRIDNPQRIYVVSGAIEEVSEKVKSVVLAGSDAEAASICIGTSGLLYPEAEVKHVYSSSFTREFYKEHLIVVGGPVNNTCTAAIINHIKEDVSFTDDFEMLVSDQVFETNYDENDRPTKDYGAIIRINNPYDHQRDIILVVGCDTYGVLAAAMLISSRNDSQLARKALQKKLGFKKYLFKQNFIAVVECGVLGDDIGNISLKYFKNIKKN